MPVKLNLSINEEAARRIKEYAVRNKTSVSRIEEQFTKLTLKPKKAESFVGKYAGTLKHPITDIESVKKRYLKEKYGL